MFICGQSPRGTLAPILTSFSPSVVSDQCFTSRRRASQRKKLARLKGSRSSYYPRMEVAIILRKRKPVLWPSSFGSQRAYNKRDHVCLATQLMQSKEHPFAGIWDVPALVSRNSRLASPNSSSHQTMRPVPVRIGRESDTLDALLLPPIPHGRRAIWLRVRRAANALGSDTHPQVGETHEVTPDSLTRGATGVNQKVQILTDRFWTTKLPFFRGCGLVAGHSQPARVTTTRARILLLSTRGAAHRATQGTAAG